MQLSSQLKKVLEKKKQELAEQSYSKIEAAAIFELYIKQAKANIPVKYWDFRLPDLTWSSIATEKLKKYIKKLDYAKQKGIGLFLYGSNGVGKSVSAAVVLKYALQRQYTARWSMLSELISLSSDGVYDKEARDRFRKEVLEVDFLVIDDIGKTFVSQKSTFTSVHIDFLFRTRSNQCLPTIVTGNLPREQIATGEDSFSKGLMELLQENLLDVYFPYKKSKRKDIQIGLEQEIFND